MYIALVFAALTGMTLAVAGQPMERGNSIVPFPMRGRSNGNTILPGQVPAFRIRMDVDGKRIPVLMPMYVESTNGPDKYESQYAPWYDSQTIVASGFSASDKQDNNIGIVKKDPATPNQGMWFGPRLGK